MHNAELFAFWGLPSLKSWLKPDHLCPCNWFNSHLFFLTPSSPSALNSKTEKWPDWMLFHQALSERKCSWYPLLKGNGQVAVWSPAFLSLSLLHLEQKLNQSTHRSTILWEHLGKAEPEAMLEKQAWGGKPINFGLLPSHHQAGQSSSDTFVCNKTR